MVISLDLDFDINITPAADPFYEFYAVLYVLFFFNDFTMRHQIRMQAIYPLPDCT